MDNKRILYVALVLIGIVAIGFGVSFLLKDPEAKVETPQNKVVNNTEQAPEEQAQVSTDERYQEYSPQLVKDEQAKGKKIVLFFHAPWCPFCRAADKDFLNQPDKIPADVVVLKTDYDTYTDLKNKYAVTYQHTFVQIDNDGNLVSKWNGGDTDVLPLYIK